MVAKSPFREDTMSRSAILEREDELPPDDNGSPVDEDVGSASIPSFPPPLICTLSVIQFCTLPLLTYDTSFNNSFSALSKKCTKKSP